MTKSDKIWLIAGLSGAAVSLLVLGAAAFGIVSLAVPYLERLDEFVAEEGESRFGPDAWHEKEAAYLDAKVKNADLYARYEIDDGTAGLYDVLYKEQDFVRVQDRLAEKLADFDDPWKVMRYGWTMRRLGALRYGYDPEEQAAVLARWTEAHPDNHFAWLVRGKFATNYAWYFRGSEFASTVTQEGWRGFRRYLAEARSHLERAYELEPNDPEIGTAMLTVCRGQSSSRGEIEEHFERATAAVPTYFYAHQQMQIQLMPKWGGSWRELEAFVREYEAKSREHGDPLLPLLKYFSYEEMRYRRRGYENLFQQPEIQREVATVFRNAVDAYPDALPLRVNYTCVLTWFPGYEEEAYNQFKLIGDRYATATLWNSLPDYHRLRVHAYHVRAHASRGAERDRILYEAIELDPKHPYAYYLFADDRYKRARYDEAEEFYREAIRVDPEYGRAWAGLGAALGRQQRFDDLFKLVEASKQYRLDADTRGRLEKMEAATRAALAGRDPAEEAGL